MCSPRSSGDAGARGARYRWVFDPLDGTTNFAHGVPIFCASLALEIDGQAVVAAVYDPNRQELFTAEAGVGSWLNGRAVEGVVECRRSSNRCSSPAFRTTCTRRPTSS